MTVAWPWRSSASFARTKRRRDDLWPAPPDPPQSVEGSQWRCTWSRTQRGHVQNQLVKLLGLLHRCRDVLIAESALSNSTFGASAADNKHHQRPPEEASLIQGIIDLIVVSVEALDFVQLMSTRVDALTSAGGRADDWRATLVKFSELTFRDLVCQPEARNVLQQLMRGGVLECHQLHSRCPHLFSSGELELQEAFELLKAAHECLSSNRGSNLSIGGTTAIDHVRITHLVQRALRAFTKHAVRIDVSEVAKKLRAVGAFRGLIALCAQVARARDPRDESLRPVDANDTRVQQLHYARLECYQVILEILEELLAGVRQQQGLMSDTRALLDFGSTGSSSQSGSGLANRFDLPELLPVPINPSNATTLLDAFLRHCLEGQEYMGDEMFHFCIFKWMTQHGLPAYRYNSQYVAGYLETHAADQPELLCRYYQNQGRWSEACDAYLALAQGNRGFGGRLVASRPEPDMAQQIELLQSAALCAQMPGSNRRAEPIRQAIVDLTQLRSEMNSSGQLSAQDSTAADGTAGPYGQGQGQSRGDSSDAPRRQTEHGNSGDAPRWTMPLSPLAAVPGGALSSASTVQPGFPRRRSSMSGGGLSDGSARPGGQ